MSWDKEFAELGCPAGRSLMNLDALDEAFNSEMEGQSRFVALCPNSKHDQVNLKDFHTLISQRQEWEVLLGPQDYEAKYQALSRTLLGEG